MSLQVNLLPEARISKLKNQARKRLYLGILGLVSGISLTTIVVFGLLQGFLVATNNVNKDRISKLNQDVGSAANVALEESATTLQQNLEAFMKLNDSRTKASRIFANIYTATPNYVSITSFSIDANDLVTLSGTTGSFADVARYQNTLAAYNVDYLPIKGLDRIPVFTDVTIASASKDTVTGSVTFGMTFKVDKELLKKQVI